MIQQSETPRTDAMELAYRTASQMAFFTRDLERELTAALSNLAKAEATIADLERRLADAEDEISHPSAPDYNDPQD